jgi:hypothetical protein
MWSTPTVQDGKNTAGPPQFDRNSHPLNVQAALWATPVASPNTNRSTKVTPTQEAGKHGEYLAVQAITHWPTPTAAVADGSQIWADGRMGLQGIAIASTHQHGTTAPDGQPSRRVLNPRFAEMLMGWIPGWTQPSLPIDRTAFALWETASCHLLRRLLGMNSPVGQVA